MKSAACTSLLCVLLALGAAGCGHDPAQPDDSTRVPPRPLTSAEGQLVSCDNSFAFKLFRETVAREDPASDVVLSPLSVAMALTMTLNGARGETQQAMQQALELSGLTQNEINASYRSLIDLLAGLDPDVIFELANSIWPAVGFSVEPEFLQLNRTYFDAEVTALDFAAPGAVDVINGWVETKTNGLIANILDNIPPGAVLYLINAIYFKGSWTHPFDPGVTEEAPFWRADGGISTCELMAMDEVEFPVFTDEATGLMVLDLPYGVGDFRMTVVLPAYGADLDSLIAGLTAPQWDAWLAGLNPMELPIYLPKFKLEYKQTLNDVLAALGMEIAFTPAADFTGISPDAPWISRVIHQAVVKIDEQGTEAAAATVIEQVTGISLNFRADHPFFFAIRDRHSGAILFMGKVADPA